MEPYIHRAGVTSPCLQVIIGLEAFLVIICPYAGHGSLVQYAIPSLGRYDNVCHQPFRGVPRSPKRIQGLRLSGLSSRRQCAEALLCSARRPRQTMLQRAAYALWHEAKSLAIWLIHEVYGFSRQGCSKICGKDICRNNEQMKHIRISE